MREVFLDMEKVAKIGIRRNMRTMIESLEAVAHNRRLPRTSLYIALALARCEDEEGAGVSELVATTGMSEGSVLRALKAMKERGHLITSPTRTRQCKLGVPVKRHALSPLSLEEAWALSPPATRLALLKSIVSRQPDRECE